MRSIINVPRELVKVSGSDWQIDWRNQSAGEDTGGGDQTVLNGFPRWIGSPKLVMGQREVMAWSALRDAARGRIAAYRFPMLTMLKGRFDAVENPRTPLSQPLVARPLSDRRAIEPRPVVITSQPAAPGDEFILVNETAFTGVIPVGWIISHNDWPMRVLWREAAGAETRLGVSFVRRTIPAGSVVDLLATGLFLAADPMMGNPEMDGFAMAQPQLQLQEWITR